MAVAGQPNVVLVIDEDAVLGGRPGWPHLRRVRVLHPLVALAGPAEGLRQEIPCRVERKHTRKRGPLCFRLPRGGTRHLKDPHIVA